MLLNATDLVGLGKRERGGGAVVKCCRFGLVCLIAN